MSRRLATVALLVATSACDPCTGVAGCTVAPHVGVAGRILDEANGRALSGVPIDLVRTGGVRLERDSIRTTTDRDGLFQFDVVAQSSGVALGYVRVSPPSATAYRVVDLQIPTSNRRGEVRTFGPWSTVARIPDYAEIYIRGNPSELAAGVDVEFRQTGGIAVEGLSNGLFRGTTAANGWVPLFGNLVRPLDVGDVIGDLTVFLPPPLGPSVRKNVHIPATAAFRPALPLRRLGIGPSLDYHIAIYRRGRFATPVQGVQVEFQRTGGVEMTPAAWTRSTDVGGRVGFPVRALGYGTVTGDLRITPPPPWKSFERRGVEFKTFEDDFAVLYDILEVGPGVGAYAVLRANGVPLKGVEVEFRRTGGVAVDPVTIKAVSDSAGFAYLATKSDVEGEVIADLTIRPPAPFASFVVRGVRMQAYDGDIPAARIIVGEWDVASPPALTPRP